MELCVKTINLTIVEMIVPYQQQVSFSYNCFLEATNQGNIHLLQFMKRYSPVPPSDWRNSKYIESYINSVDMFQFYKNDVDYDTFIESYIQI